MQDMDSAYSSLHSLCQRHISSFKFHIQVFVHIFAYFCILSPIFTYYVLVLVFALAYFFAYNAYNKQRIRYIFLHIFLNFSAAMIIVVV